MTMQFKPKTGKRGIEWCDETVNRTGGCKHACEWLTPNGRLVECYAKTISTRGVASAHYPHGFSHHYWRAPKKSQLLKNKRTPSLLFIDSMSDLFGHWVPDEHIRAVLDELRQAPQHIGQVLTKNAQKIRQFIPELPDNLWVGVSSPPDSMHGRTLTRHQQESMLKAQLRVLDDVRRLRPELVTWMSIEPLSWDISPFLVDNCPLQWAVIGALTDGRRKYQPNSAHVQNVLDILDAHNVPVFFKGNLDWSPWREDFPCIAHPALLRRQQMAMAHGWTLSTTRSRPAVVQLPAPQPPAPPNHGLTI